MLEKEANQSLQKKAAQIEIAISNLEITGQQLGLVDQPGFLKKVSKGFERLNSHNLHPLPPLERIERIKKGAEIKQKIAEIILPYFSVHLDELQQTLSGWEEKGSVGKILLDRVEKKLTIGDHSVRLSNLEYPLVEHLYDNLGYPIPARQLSEIASSLDAKSRPSWILSNVENKFGQPVFGRIARGGGAKWYLGDLQIEAVIIKSEPAKKEPKKASKRAIAVRDVADITNLIIDLVPDHTLKLWTSGKEITDQQYQDQAKQLASFALEVGDGKVEPVDPKDILQTPASQKPQLALSVLRQSLVQLILLDPRKPLEEYQYRWGRKIRELMDWLGAGAKNHLTQAIDILPEVERALVFSISSINLLKDLDYADLENCSEIRFASYLRGAVFIKDVDERDVALEELVVTACERSDFATLDLTEVIQYLLKFEYKDTIFERLLESAKFNRFRAHLMILFSSHPLAKKWAQNAEESMFSDHFLDERLPKKRIKSW